MRKFKSFTLIELALVFLLTAFCVGIAYLSLQSINKGLAVFKENASKTWDATSFYAILYQDFFESERVKTIPSGIVCEQRELEITYVFMNDGVLRENPFRVDTFNVQTIGFNSSWDHDVLQVSNGLVNHVWLKCKIGEKEHAFNLRKHYANDVVLNAAN